MCCAVEMVGDGCGVDIDDDIESKKVQDSCNGIGRLRNENEDHLELLPM